MIINNRNNDNYDYSKKMDDFSKRKTPKDMRKWKIISVSMRNLNYIKN